MKCPSLWLVYVSKRLVYYICCIISLVLPANQNKTIPDDHFTHKRCGSVPEPSFCVICHMLESPFHIACLAASTDWSCMHDTVIS